MRPSTPWRRPSAALIEARVPVDDDVRVALADTGFKPQEVNGPPEEMMRMVRHFTDELANMVSSPFEVIDALKGSAAIVFAVVI